MRFTIGFAALAAIAASPILAQDDTDPMVDAIAANTLEIERGTDGSLSGPGFDQLMEEADAAQFFLVGETHATADIADVIGNLQAGIMVGGYDYFAVEIGPWSTREVERLVRSDGSALTARINQPQSAFLFPFLSSVEEIALVETAIALSPKDRPVLWGVDQEFIAAGPLLGPMLLELSETDAQRAAAQSLTDKSASNFMYIGAAPQEEIDALVAAFADGPAKAKALVDDIAISHRIYGAFVRQAGPIYDANLERENYMKANFLKHWKAAVAGDGKAPKVFFKFGGYHMERGLSGTNVPSFGNFLMEWGRAQDFGTVHLMIDCLSGEAWQIQANKPGPCKPYGLKEGSPILTVLDGKPIGLVNLKALRPLLRRSTKIDAETRDLILSYDYYIGISDVKAATPAADLTFPPQ
ncbi:hypothetical protein [Parerythrobacter aestuarii]|uniref:hypothetical protein n=1 Tax=Parerythrobacter aestuarii TaxID=3020909 RepID=UPI0024DE662D|nr:hypothetical protein [Parerythrobacter aestuarii]